MKQKIAQFMYGRNGADAFSRFLSVFALVLIIISILIRKITLVSELFRLVGLASIVYADFRILSKNISARRKENELFFRYRSRIISYVNGRMDMFSQRKEYVFFRCPSCRSMLRLPRNKGKIRVTCRKCGCSFEKKT